MCDLTPGFQWNHSPGTAPHDGLPTDEVLAEYGYTDRSINSPIWTFTQMNDLGRSFEEIADVVADQNGAV